MTVPYRAVLKKRKAIGVELSHPYFIDGATYCKAAAEKVAMPSWFDAEPIAEALPVEVATEGAV